MSRKNTGLIVLLLITGFVVSDLAAATLLEWDGSSSVTWTTAANWAGDVVPTNTISSSGHIARFRSNVSNGRMPKITGTRSINGLRFDYNANYAQWAVDGGYTAVLSVGNGGMSIHGGATAQIDVGVNIPVDEIFYHEAGGTLILKQNVSSNGTTDSTLTLSGAAGGITQIHGAFNPAATVFLNRVGGSIKLAADNLQVAVTGNGFNGRLRIANGCLNLNGYNAQVGALDLEGAGASLDFGASGTNSVTFAASSSQDWGLYTIEVLNYNVNAPMSLRFGTNATGLTQNQLYQFVFKGVGAGGSDITGAKIDSSGYVTPEQHDVIVLTPGWVPWDGGGSDNLWTTGANWKSNPSQNEWPDNTTPDAGCNASIGYFSATENDVAEITAGMDVVIHGLGIGNGTNSSSSIGTVNMYGGTLSANYIMSASNGTTTATIKRDACQGNFNLYGGTVDVATSIAVSRDGIGTMTIEGGTITAKSLFLASRATGVGTLNLKGGVMTIDYDSPTANNFTISNGSIIDVWAGVLKYKVGGKYVIEDFQAFAAAGKIISYSNDPRAQLNIETVDGYIVISSDIEDTIAGFPTPENGAVISDPNTVLLWTAGTTAVAHNIYLSDTLSNVENAQNTASPYCIAAGITVPQFMVDGLNLGKTYYWRVDEVDASNAVVQGFIWSFTRVEYVAVETFDTYADYMALLAAGWAEEGGAYVDTVSDVDNVQAGTRAMYIDCYGSSAMTKTFPVAENWSSGNNDVALLQVYLKGKEANNLTSASFILTDAAGRVATVNFADISKLMPVDDYSNIWTRWLIPLNGFTSANPLFDLTQVKKMSISINMVGPGSIYVDSIYLLLSGCYAGHYPAGDVTGDCMIDINDLALFGRDWLRSTPVLPTANPVVWYKFDETSGATAADYSGNGYTAQAKAGGVAASSAVWSTQGKIGGCIEFDGLYCMKFSGSELSAVTDAVTVSLWINGDPKLQPGTGVTFTATDTPMVISKQLSAHTPWSSSYVYFDTGGDNTNYDRTSWFAPAEAYKYGWNHYAFTKNTQTGEQKIYHNGSLVAVTTGTTRQLNIAEMAIGMAANEVSTPYFGRVDDFRVYNVELSADEILAISGYTRKGDFAGGNNLVDQADLNAMIANWLSEVLWPAN